MSSNSGFSTDRRRFERYSMPSGLAKGALVRLELGSGFFVPVLNLSYGGLLCSGHAGNLQQMLGGGEAAGQGQPLTGALHFGLANLSTSAASFSVVHRTESTVSFSFVHDKPDLLLFLRPWLECLRQACTMTRLDTAIVKPELRDSGWSVWRGDGPVTMSLKFSPDRSPDGSCDAGDWRLVFRVDDSYGEVGMSEGKLFTRRSVDADGSPAARMDPGGFLDKKLLDLAMVYLAGCPADQNFTDELRIEMIDRLR